MSPYDPPDTWDGRTRAPAPDKHNAEINYDPTDRSWLFRHAVTTSQPCATCGETPGRLYQYGWLYARLHERGPFTVWEEELFCSNECHAKTRSWI